MKNKKKVVKTLTLSVFGLAMMNVAAIMSLRGLPMMAEEGLSLIFFVAFAAIFFLLPVSLISAELASAFSTGKGGVYLWAKEAFGNRFGFITIYLQWIQNVIWFPTVLAFCAGSLSYVMVLFWDPNQVSMLSQNNYFIVIVILVVYWLATFNSFRGIKAASKLSTIGVIAGTLVPGIFIIILGAIWALTGHDLGFMHVPGGGQARLLPDFSNFSSLAFLAGIVLLYAGMEVGAVHVKDLKNPQKEFPKAIFVSMAIIIVIFSLGSLAVASVLSPNEINLNSGLMQAFHDMIVKLVPAGFVNPIIAVLGFLTALGVVGGVAAWIAGPSKGLLATASEGDLPPFLAKMNKNNIQTNILWIQGGIVTLLALLFILIPNASVVFTLLTAITAILYLTMYLLLYITAIKLRYSHPDLKRPYRVPGGNFGMITICSTGILAVLFALVLGFFPPSQLHLKSPATYVVYVVIGVIVFLAIPFIISALKKPSWVKKPDSNK
ncbi:APC family permease [Patescibacteria group bacterium]|nr:APC family permease [Patescibacteria group bacterium]